MIKIRYIGYHQQHGTIIEVDAKSAQELINTGNYEAVDEDMKPEKKKGFPDASWFEKDIKQWLKDNGLPLEYNIKRDTKAEMIERIKIHLEK